MLPCVWNIPEFVTVPPLFAVTDPDVTLRVLVLGFSVPPVLIEKFETANVTLVDSETFPEPLILRFVLLKVPDPDIAVVVSKFKVVGFIKPLFINDEPLIMYVELPPDVTVPLLVREPFT